MDIAVSKTAKPATSTSVDSASASGTKAPKLVVINHENSKFTTQVMPSTSHNDTDTKKEQKQHKQKRKAIVVSDDDNDFEDFDFGDQDSSGISLLKKPRSSSTDKLVVIDDSDDNDVPGSENVYVRTGANDLETDHTVKRSQETAVVI